MIKKTKLKEKNPNDLLFYRHFNNAFLFFFRFYFLGVIVDKH